MRKLLILAICVLFGVMSSASFAAGGKNQIKNPILGDNCVETIPPGIDASACEEVPAPAQAGVHVFFCDTTAVIICTDEEEDAEEETP